MDDIEIPHNNRGWEKLCDSLVRENHRLKVRALRAVVANQKLHEFIASAQELPDITSMLMRQGH